MNSPRNYACTLAALSAGAALIACMSDDPPRLAQEPAEAEDSGAAQPDPAPVEPPEQPPTQALPTHTGLVSIQDVTIANQPAAGHGLTVNALFTPWVAAHFEERPGELSGCRVWSYDLAAQPAPPEQDHGTLEIAGIHNGDLRCVFQSGRGYVCPTASGEAELIAGVGMAGRTTYRSAAPLFEPSFAGRYLLVEGASTLPNNGAFPILGVASATELLVANARASEERFQARYTILAGAGPTPGAGFAPFEAERTLDVSMRRGGEGSFEFDAISLTPGAEFTLSDAAHAAIQHVPLSGEEFSLGCERCGPAPLTIVRLSTTDADLTGASPFAMPRAVRRQIELQCAAFDAQSITVPAEAMQLLREAHAASPITRIRTAFMRDGYALHQAEAPEPPNRVVLVAGHGVLGFTQP